MEASGEISAGGNPLDRESIVGLIHGSPPLIDNFLSFDEQIQPNGFDLSLQEVIFLASAGSIGADQSQRELSGSYPMEFSSDGWIKLEPGPYLVTFNEVVNLPLDVMALGRPRSSLLRSGVSVHTAVWDAGYQGRSQSLLVVHQSAGFRIQRGARLMQLIFFRMPRNTSQGYQGRYQGENLG